MTACYQVISQPTIGLSLSFIPFLSGWREEDPLKDLMSHCPQWKKKKETNVMITVGRASRSGDDTVDIKGSLYSWCAFTYTVFILFEGNARLPHGAGLQAG